MDTKIRDKFASKTWRRIKISFDADRYAELMRAIDSDITKISTLTKGNIALEPLRLERKRRANATYWLTIRDHARRLFEILSSRWSRTCMCQHSHKANLRLDIRKICDPEQSNARFSFLFTFDEQIPNTMGKLPWNWRNVEIEPVQIPNSE
jgi:hypothetical protein